MHVTGKWDAVLCLLALPVSVGSNKLLAAANRIGMLPSAESRWLRRWPTDWTFRKRPQSWWLTWVAALLMSHFWRSVKLGHVCPLAWLVETGSQGLDRNAALFGGQAEAEVHISQSGNQFRSLSDHVLKPRKH